MLRIYKRNLLEKERKKIQTKISENQKRIKKFKICIPVIFILSILLTVLIYSLGAGWYDRPLGVFLGVSLILSIIIIWALFDNLLDFKKRLSKLKGIMGGDSVKVIHCKATKLIEFQEYGDCGVNLFFQVEQNKMLYLGGQDFYPTKNFPNTGFEIAYHAHLDFGIKCLGEKLRPLKKYNLDKTLQLIESEKMEEKDIDGFYKIFEGKVEDIEKIFGIK